jgi:hypothetical protein
MNKSELLNGVREGIGSRKRFSTRLARRVWISRRLTGRSGHHRSPDGLAQELSPAYKRTTRRGTALTGQRTSS